jgi:uroporphyrinogen decarboxylase
MEAVPTESEKQENEIPSPARAVPRQTEPIHVPETIANWSKRLDSPFLDACCLKKTNYTPIWLMRQAGRYMPSYRKIREKVGFLELCKNPQLAADVTIMAQHELAVDAAIIFADILLILEPLGAELEFSKSDGPIIHNPITSLDDVNKMKPYEVGDGLDFVLEAIRLARLDLPADIPLIGFSGAPFTLASYLIEGGSSRNFEKTKTFMYCQPQAWHRLMSLLSDLVGQYLLAQTQAGSQVVQIFDSWVGCLGQSDYEQYVQPHMVRTITSVSAKVPVIHFGTATAHLLTNLAAANSAVIGLDWRVKLDKAWQEIGHSYAVQGNLDPVVLFAEPEVIRQEVKRILKEADGRPGHIFNLGHGILPNTPLSNVKYLVQTVHELSQC